MDTAAKLRKATKDLSTQRQQDMRIHALESQLLEEQLNTIKTTSSEAIKGYSGTCTEFDRNITSNISELDLLTEALGKTLGFEDTRKSDSIPDQLMQSAPFDATGYQSESVEQSSNHDYDWTGVDSSTIEPSIGF